MSPTCASVAMPPLQSPPRDDAPPTSQQRCRDAASVVIVHCAHTRYHVVRAAARTLGWLVEDEDRGDVPSSYFGVALRPADTNSNDNSNNNEGKQGSCTRCGAVTATATTMTARAAAEACGLRYSATHTPQVVWRDTSVSSSRVADMRCHQRLNHFAGMDVIARKAQLFGRLMRIQHACDAHATADGRGGDAYATLRAALTACVPRSFSSVTDVAALQAYCARVANNNNNDNKDGDACYFIVKPNKSCMGKGICVTRRPLDALTPHTRTRAGECVVQVYVPRPLLIDGRKFDLRLYVLLVSVTAPPQAAPPCTAARANARTSDNNNSNNNNDDDDDDDDALRGIELYVHEQGLVRLCGSAYAPPSRDNERDACVHLTNNAVNKRHNHDNNDEDNDVDAVTRNKRDLHFLRRYVNALDTSSSGSNSDDNKCATTAWDALLRRIDECIVLTVLSGVDVLRRALHAAGATRGVRRDARACFELLGFDMLLQDNRATHAADDDDNSSSTHSNNGQRHRVAQLQPVLMEVNHSPSLFCDSVADLALKHAIVTDALRCVQASSLTAPLPLCDADGATAMAYAQYMRRHRRRRRHDGDAKRDARDGYDDASAAAAVTPSSSCCGRCRRNGFVQLLPRYARDADATGAAGSDADEQRQRRRQLQRDMLRLARTLT